MSGLSTDKQWKPTLAIVLDNQAGQDSVIIMAFTRLLAEGEGMIPPRNSKTVDVDGNVGTGEKDQGWERLGESVATPSPGPGEGGWRSQGSGED